MEQREAILQSTMRVFNQSGFKFTMDDIAKDLGISKKTIYTVFDDKESMFLAMVDYLFDGISESKQAILEDENLSTVEKIRKIMGAMPDSYKNIDFTKLYTLKDKYPTIYAQVEKRLETGWEPTIMLIEQGMREGVIKKVDVWLVKMMMEASLEQFFQRDILVRNNVDYVTALNEVVNVLIDGISTGKE